MNCQQLFVNSSKGKKSALAKRVSLHADVMDLFSGMPGPRLTRSEVRACGERPEASQTKTFR